MGLGIALTREAPKSATLPGGSHRRRRSGRIHQPAGEIDHLKCIGVRLLLQVRAGGMPTLGVFVIEERKPHLLHPRGEFSWLARRVAEAAEEATDAKMLLGTPLRLR